jgi:hypothetical protein
VKRLSPEREAVHDDCARRYDEATKGKQREPTVLYRCALKGGTEGFMPLPARLGKKAARQALATRLGASIAVFRLVTYNEALLAETGDALALKEPDLAVQAYGLTNATRPGAAMRRVRRAVWGDSLDAVADLALAYQKMRPGWSKCRAAEEAVALAAKNGTWIGVYGPVSFEEAVDAVYREMLAQREKPVPGDTGRMIFVRPASDALKLPYPYSTQLLSEEGAWVPDTSYWRRRVADGSVVQEAIQEKKGEQ